MTLGSAVASIVIPAHNEAAVIGRMLATIVADSEPGEFELVIATNGCTDSTAAVARRAAPSAVVLEIAEGSKIAALNAADEVATTFPRVYLDADVTISVETLRELVRLLTSERGPLAAAPTLAVETGSSNWWVRAHYRIWAESEYRQDGLIGSGVYALSERGRARFDAFPDVIADDRFVMKLFTPAERSTLPDHSFTVRAPATFRAQIRRAIRIARGNNEIEANTVAFGLTEDSSHIGALVGRVARRPSLWVSFPVYCVGYATPKLLARRAAPRNVASWNRDDSTRV